MKLGGSELFNRYISYNQRAGLIPGTSDDASWYKRGSSSLGSVGRCVRLACGTFGIGIEVHLFLSSVDK
jgi:hypothetical protein